MRKHRFFKCLAVSGAFCSVAVSAAVLFWAGPAFAASDRLVVLPFEIFSDKPMDFLNKGVRSMLASRLGGTDITIVDDAQVAMVLEEASVETVTDKDSAVAVAGALGADFALYGTITSAAGGYSLDLELLNLKEEPPEVSGFSDAGAEGQLIPRLARVAHQVRGVIEGKPVPTVYAGDAGREAEEPGGPYQGLFAHSGTGPGTEGPLEKGLFQRSEERPGAFSPTGSISLQMGPMGFDIADLNGNGSPEILVVGRGSLIVYSKKEGRYSPAGSLDSPFGENFLKVSVGDINGSGRPEIYLVGRYGERARTTIYEWQGSFRQIHRMRGHLCVVAGPEGTGPVLVYQNSGVSRFFSGPLHFAGYRGDGKPEVGTRIPGLEGARIYSLARGDLDGDGVAEWVGVNEDKRMVLWSSDGRELWRGSTRISGSNNSIIHGEVSSPGDIPPTVEFDPRMVVTDLNGDGRNEVLAVRNIALVEGFIEYLLYLKASITAYSLDGNRLVASWNTREIPYCVTDMKVYDGAIYVSGEKGRAEKIGRGSGRLMWFE